MPPQKVSVKPANAEDKAAKNGKPPLNKKTSKIFSISGAKTSSKVADVESNVGGAVNGKVNDITIHKASDKDVKVPSPAPFNPSLIRDRVSWLAVLYTSIPDAIGVAGVKYALNVAENRFRRLFWILFITAGCALTTYQVTDRISYFISYPKGVDIAIDYVKHLPLPAIAICNYNQYKISEVSGTPFGSLLSQYASPYPQAINYTTYEPWLSGVNMTQLLIDYSPTMEEMFLQGFLGSTTLTTANFTRKFTNFGTCYTFNSGEDGQPPINVSAWGPNFGFKLILDVHQDQYFLEEFNRYAAGFHVILYDRGTQPIEDLGFAIQPGVGTYAALDVREVTNLGPPHGVCEDKKLKYFSYYGQPECYMECMENYLVGACGCKSTFLPGNASVCDPIQYFQCGGPAYAAFLEQVTTNCSCPVPCYTKTYVPRMSYTTFPSNYWANLLADIYFADDNLTASYFSENMCYLSIYFREMSIERITQQKAYEFFSLLCDIGGSLGLWLGGSVLTVIEFLDLFGHSVYVYSRRIPRNNRP